MVCPNCGYRASANVSQCPRCNSPLTADEQKKKSVRTAADNITGVLFLVIGVLLLVVFIPSLITTFGPAVQSVMDLPKPANIDDVAYVAGSRFYRVPVILAGFSDLMWTLAGLFMLFGGAMALSKGRGRSQVVGAVVLMLFGLFADLAAAFILFQQVSDVSVAQRLKEAFGQFWWGHILEVALIIVVVVLLGFKKRSQKKRKFQQARDKAQAQEEARR